MISENKIFHIISFVFNNIVAILFEMMKFGLGDLIKFIRTDFTYESNKIIIPKFLDLRRGNSIGIVVEINLPEFDSRLFYTYRVVYQNGYTTWEVEDNLRDLKKYHNRIKYIKKSP